MTNAPAGWYPDPEYAGQQRYWDGTAWTVNRAPAPTSEPAGSPASDAVPSKDTSMAVLALALAICGFVLGVFPFAAWFAWLAFTPALILAIRTLVKRRPGTGQAVASTIVAGVGWMIALVVGVGSFGMASHSSPVGNAIPTSTPSSTAPPSPTPVATAPQPSPSPSAPPAMPGIGQTVTSRGGVSFTVSSAQCGLGAQDSVFGGVAPKGQFCKVDFVVANGGSQPQDVSTWDLYGYIGAARYQAETTIGNFGDDSFSTTVNPGLSVPCTVFFDVPAGAQLDRVKLITGWWGGDGATVALR